MTQWQPPKREPARTKAELREMLAEAVRNTQAERKHPAEEKTRGQLNTRVQEPRLIG